jgi:hypothetical protein
MDTESKGLSPWVPIMLAIRLGFPGSDLFLALRCGLRPGAYRDEPIVPSGSWPVTR